MNKILGIAAAILLCSAVAMAGERGVSANTGPPSSEWSSKEVAIGVQVRCLGRSVAVDIGVIFNQTACVNHGDDAVTTAGDIELWFNRVAIGLWFNRVAFFMSPRTAISICFDELAIFMGPAEMNTLESAFETAIMLMRHNSLASSAVANDSGMASTEVDSLSDTKMNVAFIHTRQNTVFC